ncbi:translation initiation factor IF-2 [Streptomyces buecherae]|uniref:ABC transporter permease n=1 Tax=Streptomyces buecherae TaxID=2763006 RepID=UPI0033F1C8D7
MKGLTWVVWRQHRLVAWTMLAFAVAAACYLGYRFHQQHAFQQDNGIVDCDILLPTCHGKPVPDANVHQTGSVTHTFATTYREVLLDAGSAVPYVPVLIAVFMGAPLFARDLESGTYRLAITQSVSPRRWLAAKLTFALALTLCVSLVMTAAYGWWWHSTWRDFGDLAWESPATFYGTGPVAVAIALLGVVLGATVGLIVRRTLPAMVITLGACYGVLSLLLEWRPAEHLWPLSTARAAAPNANVELPRYAEYHFEGYQTSSGEKLSHMLCDGANPDRVSRCLERHDVVSHIIEYHPASAYWPMQWVLAGICLALAVALFAGCLWWVGRRTA